MNASESFADQIRRFAIRIAESGAPALAGLYDLSAQRLIRYAATITRHQQDAEDAVGAALLKVSANPELLCTATQPWAYLLRMVRNEALVILRRGKRCSLSDNLADLVIVRRVDQIEVEEMHRAVWMAMRTLPAEQSEIVALKIWEGLTFAQIAEILELPLSTAASRYRYAIEKLSEKLRHNSEVPQ